MTTYIEIQKQIEVLKRQAETLKAQERGGVIERIKDAVAVYGITAAELGLASGGQKKVAHSAVRKTRVGRRSSAAAYSDGNGNTWAGRGKRPNWLREALARGATLEDFAAKP